MRSPITRSHRGAFRGLVLSAALAVLLASHAGSGAVRAQEDGPLPKGEDLMDKHVEVTGGKAAYDKIENRVSKGTFKIEAQGIEASFALWAARPARLYTLLQSDALGKIEKGTDGEVAWEKSVMGGPSVKDGQEKIDYLREATFDKVENWRKVYKTAECVGKETIGETECHKVVLTPAEGKPQTFYFTAETNLIARVEGTIETAMGSVSFVSHPEDLKEVDGILVPFTIRARVLGQERVITFESIEHNVEMPPDRFDLPEEIRALLKKEQEKKRQEEAGAPQGEEEKGKRKTFHPSAG